jgi:hypothetical protein
VNIAVQVCVFLIMAIIVLIGLVVLDRPELAIFGLVVFLTQVPLVLGGVVAARKWRGATATP